VESHRDSTSGVNPPYFNPHVPDEELTRGGETESDAARLNFDHRFKLEFHGSGVISDAGSLAYRELDDVLGLMARPALRSWLGMPEVTATVRIALMPCKEPGET